MTIFGVAVCALAGLSVYLGLLAVVVVLSDETLGALQKVAQCLLSVFIPLLGPLTVLFMAHTVSPWVLRWVPWPFKSMVSDKAIKRYSSEAEQSGDSYF